MALKQQQILLSRLQKLVGKWPSDPSKKGRDFGEFLKQTYAQKFKEAAVVNPEKAAAAVESLERLNSNYYRRLYAREKELSFTGELAAKNPWILSNENLDKMQKSRSLWERFTGRKKDYWQ